MNDADRDALVAAVQTNCDIADARHATDLTLCTYLLQMRELFRWHQSLPFEVPLSRADVGAWIAEREMAWSRLEDQPYQALPWAHHRFEPFDVEGINAVLRPAQLTYGAGLLGADQPIFYLAELHDQFDRDGVAVTVAGREYARGLLTPPAALGHSTGVAHIELRREALARWCWQKFEAFGLLKKSEGHRQAAMQAYGLDQGFDAALPRWLDEQAEVMLLHELGEVQAGQMLGPSWADMRLALSRRANLYARAVRDHMADLGMTLPTLLERQAKASVHMWFASYDGLREQLFPGLTSAYKAWLAGSSDRVLSEVVDKGRAHFTHLAQTLVLAHEQGGKPAELEQRLMSPAAVCPDA